MKTWGFFFVFFLSILQGQNSWILERGIVEVSIDIIQEHPEESGGDEIYYIAKIDNMPSIYSTPIEMGGAGQLTKLRGIEFRFRHSLILEIWDDEDWFVGDELFGTVQITKLQSAGMKDIEHDGGKYAVIWNYTEKYVKELEIERQRLKDNYNLRDQLKIVVEKLELIERQNNTLAEKLSESLAREKRLAESLERSATENAELRNQLRRANARIQNLESALQEIRERLRHIANPG